MVNGTFYEFNGTSEAERLEKLATDLSETYLWVVWAIGFPGNILCVLTIMTMSISSPATFLVSVLSISDGLAISHKFLIYQLGRQKVVFGSVGCKSMFLSTFFSTVANWTLVLICGERYISVCFPLKKIYLVTRRRCQVSVIIMFISLFVLFASFYIEMRDSDPSGYKCGTLGEYYDFWVTIWYWISSTLLLFLPFGCIAVLTALIVRGLMRTRRERREIFGKASEGSKRLMNESSGYSNLQGSIGCRSGANQRVLKEAEAVEKSITVMLILAAVVFLVFSLPTCVHLLTYKSKEVRDRLQAAKWELFNQIGSLLIDSTHAINFFLYFFSAQRFRQQLYHLICCRRSFKRDRQSKTIEMTNITHP